MWKDGRRTMICKQLDTSCTLSYMYLLSTVWVGMEMKTVCTSEIDKLRFADLHPVSSS